MNKEDKEKLSKGIAELIAEHEVMPCVTYDWGNEPTWWCTSCNYLGDQELPSLHTSNIVLEYVESYYLYKEKG